MAVLHRALLTWFVLLVFLILLCLRLESRTHWNWFIVFVPLWAYDAVLLLYVAVRVLTQCAAALDRQRVRASLRRHATFVCGVVLKMTAQVVVCAALELPHLRLPAWTVLAPIWLLLPVLAAHLFSHLIRHSRAAAPY